MKEESKDHLFREKLGDFSREPDPAVWERIEASLDQKKRRRALPFWLPLGGVAAAVILALFLWSPGTGVPEAAPEVTRVPATQTPEPDNRPDALRPDIGVPGDAVTAAEGKREDAEAYEPSPDAPAADRKAADRNAAGPRGTRQDNRALAVSDTGQEPAGRPQTDALTSGEPDGRRAETLRDPARDAVAASDTGVPDRRNPQHSGADPMPDTGQNDTLPRETAGKSIFDALAEAEADEDEPGREGERGRWAVGPQFAPVYYSSFGDGSPIAPNFVSNSKSGTLNLSYGLSVSYAVTPKLNIRSGINRVDLGYNTNQVAFTSTFAAGPTSLIRTISYSANARNVVVESTADANQVPDILNNASAEALAPSPAREGRMIQQFGYLEVPLELEYRILDQRFGVNVIGGMSSLFLTDNSVSLAAEGAVTEIGEATNMNSVGFSTNVGLGLNYQMNPRLQLEVQPMFKYHLNTFSDTAGNFRPFAVGVYSGIRYRF